MEKNSGKRLLNLLLVTAVIFLCGMPHIASADQIDVLVLYDDYSAARLGGEPAVVMKSWQNQINTFYRSSDIDLQLRVVGVEKYNAPGSSMNQVLRSNTSSSEVAGMRNRVGADFVTQLHKTGSCGIGWAAVDAQYAFNVIGASCGPMAMAHELGHNMGLNHSRAQGDQGGVKYPYGLGYLEKGNFGTIMSYAQQYRAKEMPLFSNPDKMCNGRPCGVPEGQSDQADAHKAINNVKARLAGFRAAVVPGGDDDSTDDSTDGGDDADVPECQTWTATNDQHVAAQRAYVWNSGSGCDMLLPPGYYASGTVESLGQSGSVTTSVYTVNGGQSFHVGTCANAGGSGGGGAGCN